MYVGSDIQHSLNMAMYIYVCGAALHRSIKKCVCVCTCVCVRTIVRVTWHMAATQHIMIITEGNASSCVCSLKDTALVVRCALMPSGNYHRPIVL